MDVVTSGTPRSTKPTRQRVEFGDFQTPVELAREVCRALANRRPRSLLEPTCGTGTFLAAALEQFPQATCALGIEIHPEYVRRARSVIGEARLQRGSSRARENGVQVDVRRGDFFQIDWSKILAALPEPILIVGNPPWVTNAGLSRLGSGNLPQKSNFQQHRGLEAHTGRSNFDISEFMLLHLLERLDGRRATLAMLCKTAVARRTLAHAWKSGWRISRAEMRRIDAGVHFDAAVDACLLVCDLADAAKSDSVRSTVCDLFATLGSRCKSGQIGWRDGRLVANVVTYERSKHLLADSSPTSWRSGIKHDCAAVMELRREGNRYRNGLGEWVDVESTSVFPMLKSSDLATRRQEQRDRYMLVPQRRMTDDTSALVENAPKTWRYLEAHADLLNRRASSVYAHRPPYAIFGVGEYSFTPWKVAVSGLYKHPHFVAVGKRRGKPVVFDDTAYFLPCEKEAEARRLASLLNSESAREFFSAFLFRDSKRPMTAELLRRLDLSRLAAHET